MIVPYLSDVAIYCKQAEFLFSSHSGSSTETQAKLLSLHICLCCTLCCEFTLPRSKKLQGFELQPQLKDNAVAVACDFEISNLFLFLKGRTDKTANEALFVSVLFLG